MKTKLTVLGILMFAVLALNSFAQQRPTGGMQGGAGMAEMPLLAALDTNRDGTIDAGESAAAATALRTLDKNGDGQLTPDEIMGARGGRGGMQGPPAGAAGRGRGPGGQPAQPVFQALDANHDGIISGAEIDNAPAALATLDQNHDGVLAIEELMGPPGEPIVLALDLNKDGVLEANEIAQANTSLLTLDRNGDGQLTREEFSPMRGGRGAMQMAGDAPRGRGPGGPMPDPIMQALDVNQDGVMDAQEISGASTALLRLDKNGDGKLTPDEIRRR
jgi:Ca2+-binding EF-hand superfamily protein